MQRQIPRSMTVTEAEQTALALALAGQAERRKAHRGERWQVDGAVATFAEADRLDRMAERFVLAAQRLQLLGDPGERQAMADLAATHV